MTRRTKVAFDLPDLTRIRFTCNNSECGGQVSGPPSTNYKLPSECPYGETSWADQIGERNLLNVVRDILRRENGRIRLECEVDVLQETQRDLDQGTQADTHARIHEATRGGHVCGRGLKTPC